LKGAGIRLELTKITHKVHGQHVEVESGAMVVAFGDAQYTGQANDTGKVLIFGGAGVNQTVHHGFKQPPPPPTPKPKPTHTNHGGTNTNTGGGGGVSSIPPVDNPPSGPVSDSGPGPTTAGPQFPVANGVTLPDGLKVGWIIAALIGAGLLAIGMRRLPDQVLQPTGTTCRLEEQQ
jgi:hypothetical protein